MKKIIPFYVREVYGNRLEYVVNEADAAILRQLTGQKTINGVMRKLMHDLSSGGIVFQQVLPPHA
jgi:hypothetical protein